jgi:DNA primase large subunit
MPDYEDLIYKTLDEQLAIILEQIVKYNILGKDANCRIYQLNFERKGAFELMDINAIPIEEQERVYQEVLREREENKNVR